MSKLKIVHASLAAAVLLSVVSAPAANATPDVSSSVANVASKKLSPADKWVLPLKSKSYRATSAKGPRCIPVRGGSTEHMGQDLGTTNGAPIYAAAAGKVIGTRQGTNNVSGYILIQHNVGGVLYTGAYYHMWSATTHVKVGSTVKAGQQIAKVGNSGPSTAPHLHFELWRGGWYQGTAVDPVKFVKDRGVDLYAHATAVYPNVRPANCTYYLAEGTALRKSASTSGTLIKNLGKGTRITAKPAAGANKHLQVTANGVTGWIRMAVVTPNFVAAPAPVKVTTVAAYTNAKYKTTAPLNMRASARDGRVIRTLAKGAEVTATGKTALSTGWLEVRVSGATGWVSKSYLSKVSAPKPGAIKPLGNVKPKAPVEAAPKPAPKAPVQVAPKSATKYTVKSNLNLRASAKTGKVLVTMKKGSTVTATGKNAHSGTWIQVKSGSKTGWASAKYLTKQKAAVSQSAKPKPNQSAPKATARKTTGGLNMRAGAGTKYRVVSVLKAKTTVNLTGKKSGKWVQVKVGKKTGWVSSSYLK